MLLAVAYAGNERDAANRQLLKDAKIDHVLNVTSHVPLHFADDVTMTYRRIPATDSSSQNLKQFFSDVVAFIGPFLRVCVSISDNLKSLFTISIVAAKAYNMFLIITSKPIVVLLLSVLLLVSFMNMYSVLHAFVISVIDC